MPDPRFFKRAGPFSLSELATAVGADAKPGEAGPGETFVDVAPLQSAEGDCISFLDNKKYIEAFKTTRAGACIVAPNMSALAPTGTALIVTPEPYHAYARIAQMFYPDRPATGARSSSAIIDASARIADSVDIAAGAVIGAAAEIDAHCRIGANAVIGGGVHIGADTIIGPSTTIACAEVGARCIVHAGVRIGQDGFGFALGLAGHVKVPQLGRVLIGDDVEIGANTTIDRGTGPDTVIGSGTKIDNLVQIGHNVVIGDNCVIVSHVGISGSTELGDFVVVGGQVGIAGHLHVGSGARIAAQSGIMRDVPPGQELAGTPAKPMRQWFREVATLEKQAKKRGD